MTTRTRVMALALAGTIMIGSAGTAMAFRNPLKDAMKSTTTTETTQPAASDSAASTQQPASSGPIVYINDKFSYKVEIPSGWQQMDGGPKTSSAMFFEQGNKGSFQVNANWMAEDFPVDSSLQAMEKQYKERVKHGELVKYYRKDFTMPDSNGKNILFKGYVTIETTEDNDPDIQRMQWIGYGKGNYYNFTWASNPQQFDTYMPKFEEIMNKIVFVQ